MWSPLARQPAEVGRAGRDELRPPVGEVRRHLDADAGHQPARLGDQVASCPRSSTGAGPLRRGRGAAPSPSPVRQYASAASVGDLAPAPRRSSGGAGRSSAGSPPGGGRARRAPPASASSEAIRSSSVSPMPDEDPARERDLQLAGGADRLQPQRGVLGRRALVGDEVGALTDSSISPCEAVTSRSRARSSRDERRRGSCAAAARARAPARSPDDVGGEVLEAVARRAARAPRVWLGRLAGEHEQLLDAAPRGAGRAARSTSSGSCRCGWCVANAQYLQ